MVRPMEGGWPLQPNQQPPPHMAGHHPPPSGTPTSANQPPMSVTPPTSGIVQPPTGNHQQPPQMPGANGQNQPGAAAAAAAGMYNFMQHQSLPHQFTATYPQLLQLHGQPSLLQQPMMTQGQPVTSMASGNIQFPYGVPQSHHGNSSTLFDCPALELNMEDRVGKCKFAAVSMSRFSNPIAFIKLKGGARSKSENP